MNTLKRHLKLDLEGNKQSKAMTSVQYSVGREDAEETPVVVQYGSPQLEQPVYVPECRIARARQYAGIAPSLGETVGDASEGDAINSPRSRSLCPWRPSAGGLPTPKLPVHGRAHSNISTTSSTEHSRHSSSIFETADGDSSAMLSQSGTSVRRESRGGGEDVLVVVQFKWGRLGDFKCNLPLTVGTAVLVEADRGTDLGMVQSIDTLRDPEDAEWRIIRAATRKEQDKWQRLLVTRESTARKKAQTIIDEAGLSIQIQHAEYQFDKKKLTLHYTCSEARPNFRTVLDELFAVFRCRVWFARYSGDALERDRTNKDLAAKRKQLRRSAAVEESRSENSTRTGPSTSPMDEVILSMPLSPAPQ